MLKVSLTHDIDRIAKTYQNLTHPMKYALRGNIRGAAGSILNVHRWRSIYWNIEDIMEMENQFGVKSTFFFLNESIPFQLFNFRNWPLSLGRYSLNEKRVVEAIKTLDSRGWEIGLHGSYRSFSDKRLLADEKSELERILGRPVVGIRQHYLNLDEPDTWVMQQDLGFEYDASYGYTRSIGFKGQRVRPFKPFGAKDFVVFPLQIMDFCFMETPNNMTRFREICTEVDKNNAVLVLNWHNDVFSEVDFPGYRHAYSTLIQEFLAMGAEIKPLGKWMVDSKVEVDTLKN